MNNQILAERLNTYSEYSERLSGLTDSSLSQLVDSLEDPKNGIAGYSGTLNYNGTLIFLKSIPITDFEQVSENFNSTSNLFDLPLFYQYGIGSTGFGAWRELEAHRMASQWVVKKQSQNFPLLYHWRILPSSNSKKSTLADLEKSISFWDNHSSIKNRLIALNETSYELVLFLEYFPMTLNRWLGEQSSKGDAPFIGAIEHTDKSLSQIIHFMKKNNFIHFDMHFENLLTDEAFIYVSDFGLAISKQFELSEEEHLFFKQHQNYDYCSTQMHLLDTIESNLPDLHKCITPKMKVTIDKHSLTAKIISGFYHKLKNKSKQTPYPHVELDKLFSDVY